MLQRNENARRNRKPARTDRQRCTILPTARLVYLHGRTDNAVPYYLLHASSKDGRIFIPKKWVLRYSFLSSNDWHTPELRNWHVHYAARYIEHAWVTYTWDTETLGKRAGHAHRCFEQFCRFCKDIWKKWNAFIQEYLTKWTEIVICNVFSL